MDSPVPDYIFASGITAQQARSRRAQGIRPTSARIPVPADNPAIEIKPIIGQIQGAHRAWPEQMHFDLPRLIQL
ncbi:hypothetical protein IW140_000291 [Coemansia sp. RSA 1813]|nr:hypothetical protein EV178_000492 [Coemansia sp. RSA 1646]KAJ2573247.1 hypothetical protein IW140_000291 [Coemansia sp. RSA 1813]